MSKAKSKSEFDVVDAKGIEGFDYSQFEPKPKYEAVTNAFKALANGKAIRLKAPAGLSAATHMNRVQAAVRAKADCKGRMSTHVQGNTIFLIKHPRVKK